MTQLLLGKTALVTGASRGLGRAAALALAKQGAHIIATARTQGGLEELDDEIKAVGSSATLVPMDIVDYPAIDRLGAAIFERWKKLDILIGNAGLLGKLTPMPHIEPKSWDDVMAVNVTAKPDENEETACPIPVIVKIADGIATETAGSSSARFSHSRVL